MPPEIRCAITVAWKIVVPLGPHAISHLHFAASPNTGLYQQFAVAELFRIAAESLAPTNVAFQAVARQCGFGATCRPPYKLQLDNFGAVNLHLKFRQFDAALVGVTATLRGMVSRFDVESLVSLQRLAEIPAVTDIVRCFLTLMLTGERDVHRLNVSLASTPALHLDGFTDRPMQSFLRKHDQDFVATLIHHTRPTAMSSEIARKVIEKNVEHNLEWSDESLLIDKQGLLYVTPAGSSSSERICRAHDLFELARVFEFFLLNREVCSNDAITRLETWLETPQAVFRRSKTTGLEWDLIANELGLRALLKAGKQLSPVKSEQ